LLFCSPYQRPAGAGYLAVRQHELRSSGTLALPYILIAVKVDFFSQKIEKYQNFFF
jgi:hypothetical protein